jgi:hypothetical protein
MFAAGIVVRILFLGPAVLGRGSDRRNVLQPTDRAVVKTFV